MNFKRILCIILVLFVLFNTSCDSFDFGQADGSGTTESSFTESTPIATPEESSSDETPTESTPIATPGQSTVTDPGESTPAENPELDPPDTFSIHVLELGNNHNGDCIFIEANDVDILIDAGSRSDSADDIIDYVNDYCDDGVLEYVIVTHAHQDHIAAFSGTWGGKDYNGNEIDYNGIFYYYGIGTIIDFPQANSTSNVYQNYVMARNYAVKNGAMHHTAYECILRAEGAERQYQLTDCVTMTILNTEFYANETSDENDHSVCVMFTYTYGDTVRNYLFTGDLEADGEESLMELNDLPEVDFFKAGHHGSKTSSGRKLLSVIKPKNVVVSCVAGNTEYTKYYQNTFPTQELIDRVSVYTESVYVTSYYDHEAKVQKSLNGNIIYKTCGDDAWFICSGESSVLKDTTWFNSTVYVVGSTITDRSVAGGREVQWRVWKD